MHITSNTLCKFFHWNWLTIYTANCRTTNKTQKIRGDHQEETSSLEKKVFFSTIQYCMLRHKEPFTQKTHCRASHKSQEHFVRRDIVIQWVRACLDWLSFVTGNWKSPDVTPNYKKLAQEVTLPFKAITQCTDISLGFYSIWRLLDVTLCN